MKGDAGVEPAVGDYHTVLEVGWHKDVPFLEIVAVQWSETSSVEVSRRGGVWQPCNALRERLKSTRLQRSQGEYGGLVSRAFCIPTLWEGNGEFVAGTVLSCQ